MNLRPETAARTARFLLVTCFFSMACGRSELDPWASPGASGGSASSEPAGYAGTPAPGVGPVVDASGAPDEMVPSERPSDPSAGCATDCDDGNACTRDHCSPALGCLHVDVASECAPSDDPCRVAACDPEQGCVTRPVTDGTSCGTEDCVVAQVCIAGACVETKVPEGRVCAAPGLCRGAGVCRNQLCELPPPSKPTPLWSHTLDPDPAAYHSEIALDADGHLYVVSRSTAASKVVSLTRDGFVRFERTTSGWLNGLDDELGLMFLSGSRAQAEARTLSNGELLWQADLSADIAVADSSVERGSFQTQGGAVLPGKRIVVFGLQEGISSHTSYVIAFDVDTGRKLWTVRHPGHLYGMVVDSGGNLYLSRGGCWAPFDITFSLSSEGKELWTIPERGVPLAVDRGMTLMDHRGILRLLRTDGGMDHCSGPPIFHLVADERTIFGVEPAGRLNAIDPKDCSVRWSVAPSRSKFTDKLVTSGGGLLVVDFAEPAPDTNQSAVLRELNADGSELSACEFAPNARAIALDRERLFVGGANTISAFEAPGLELKSKGWVSHRGNSGRSNFARSEK